MALTRVDTTEAPPAAPPAPASPPAPAAAPPAAPPASPPVALHAFRFLVDPTFSTAKLFTEGGMGFNLLRFLLERDLLECDGLRSVWTAPRTTPYVRELLYGEMAASESDSDEAAVHGKGSRPRQLLNLLPAPTQGGYGFSFGDPARAWRLNFEAGHTVLSEKNGKGVWTKLEVAVSLRAPAFASARAAVEELHAAAAEYAKSLRGDTASKVRVQTISGKLDDLGRDTGTSSFLPKRPLSTIFLPDAIKLRASEEISLFQRSKEAYARFGIPHRRALLFAGPPGTGKTSLIHALASEHGLPIFTITVGPDTTDEVFASSLRSIDERHGALLVLEDVDALFTADRGKDSEKTQTALSFSGLLNALDGLGAPSGCVLVLTTNYIDRLDPALLRPGRIDTVYTFAPVTPAATGAMVASLLPAVPEATRDAVVARIRAEPACSDLSSAVLQKWLFDARGCADLAKELPKLFALCAFFKERAGAAHRRAPVEIYA